MIAFPHARFPWLAALLLAASTMAQTTASRVVTDLRYVSGSDAAEEHHLDVYLPDGEQPPMVMFIHGGNWKVGDRRGFALVGRALMKQGLACAVIDFRQSPEVAHPVLVEDCAKAFAWLAGSAEDYGYDLEQLYVMGHSSGAHLASLLALDHQYLDAVGVDPGRIRGVIAVSGVYDVSLELPLLMEVFGDDHEVRRRASPLRLVRRDAPPFLLLWAENELLGLDWSAESMSSRLRRRGARVESAELPGRNHATILTTLGKTGDTTTPRIVEFLRRVERGWPLADRPRKAK